MKTALEKLEYAIKCDTEKHEFLQYFLFRYGGYVIDYCGSCYAYVYPEGDEDERSKDEYCWSGYAEMLGAEITQTGKTMRQMLAELPAHDLELTIDSGTPHSVPFVED